ncbi:MAG TPA: hypothetical protein VGM26_00440 [Rhizomicrobium sp.]
MGSTATRRKASLTFAICLSVSQFAWPFADAFAQSAPTPAAAPENHPPGLQVPSAGPGVFSAKPIGANHIRLTVTGRAFSGRDAAEKYLAYRAAQLTLERKSGWFSFIQTRAKGDSAPKPKRDPAGMRYSFRMAYFQPVWRYKTAGAQAWKSWSPFSGAPFWADGIDSKSVTDFQVTADIAVQKGPYQDDDPLAFDAAALSDFLVNQVGPSQ